MLALPLAISTIIVSPIARPKPRATAANTPGNAAGSTTCQAAFQWRRAQCQSRLHVAARHTGQRILRDRKDHRDHGKTQRNPGAQRVQARFIAENTAARRWP